MTSMPAVIVFSLAAIALMVALIRLSGIERRVSLDEEQVRQAIARHYEGARIARIVLDRDGRGALVYLEGDPALVLVRALGDRLSLRPVSRAVLKSLTEKNDDLIFVLHDITWPPQRLRLADAPARQAEAARLHAALNGAQEEGRAHA